MDSLETNVTRVELPPGLPERLPALAPLWAALARRKLKRGEAAALWAWDCRDAGYFEDEPETPSFVWTYRPGTVWACGLHASAALAGESLAHFADRLNAAACLTAQHPGWRRFLRRKANRDHEFAEGRRAARESPPPLPTCRREGEFPAPAPEPATAFGAACAELAALAWGEAAVGLMAVHPAHMTWNEGGLTVPLGAAEVLALVDWNPLDPLARVSVPLPLTPAWGYGAELAAREAVRARAGGPLAQSAPRPEGPRCQ